MSKLGTWSTTPGSNNSTPPDGWPEGQAPSTVNNCAREMMASLRTVFNDSQYFDAGFSPTYVSATTFTVPGDQTSSIHADRRLKVYDGNTLYATVVTASYTVVTTVQILADSGNLTSSLSSIALSILSKNNDPLPRNLSIYAGGGGGGGSSLSSANVTGTLSVGGVTRLANTLSVSGAAAVGGTLIVGGATTLAGTLSVSGAAVVKGALSVGGALTVNSGIAFTGALAAGATLSVSGASVLKGGVSIGGVGSTNSHFDFNSTTYFAGNSQLDGIVAFNGTLISGVTSAPNANWNSFFQSNAGHPAVVAYGAGLASTAVSYLNGDPAGYFALFNYGIPTSSSVVGSINTDGVTTSYNTTSDHRLKENVRAIVNGAAAMVMELRPCTFTWINNPELGKVQGFIAHEVQDVVPQAVTGVKNGERMQMLDASKLVPLLTAALQEALRRIDSLEHRLSKLGG